MKIELEEQYCFTGDVSISVYKDLKTIFIIGIEVEIKK